MKRQSTESINIINRESMSKTLKRKDRAVIKNRVLKAKKEAQEIIESAQNYAQQIREDAEKDAKDTLTEAYRQGIEDAVYELENNLLHAKEIREKVIREAEIDILKLSIKLAEKIVGREIEEDKKTIVDIVSTALQNARQQERITIKVNPNDLQIVQKKAEDFKSYSQTKYLDFVADPRVESGGCLIESEVGTVDARLETQFRVLERAMLAQADGEFAQESL